MAKKSLIESGSTILDSSNRNNNSPQKIGRHFQVFPFHSIIPDCQIYANIKTIDNSHNAT